MIVYTVETIGGQITSYEANKENLPKFLESPLRKVIYPTLQAAQHAIQWTIVVTSENRDEVEQELNDRLFVSDSVTWNASGSYTCNSWEAEEYICHNFDLLGEALTEFGCDMSYLERGAEELYAVTCYAKQFRKYWTKWKRRKRNYENFFCTSGNKVLMIIECGKIKSN